MLSTWLIVSTALWASPPLHLGGKIGRAQHLTRLERSAGDDAESALRLAQGLGAERHLRDALMWLRRAEARGAHPLRVVLVRAEILQSAGRPGEAASAWLEAIEAAPHNAHAHLSLWRLLRDVRLPDGLDRSRLRKAVVAAGYHIGVAPSRPRDRPAAQALVARGAEAMKAGRFGAAIELFEAAIDLDDDLESAFYGLGAARERQGDRPRAAAAWRIFLSLATRDTRQRRQAQRAVDDDERHRGLAARR